MVFSFIIIFLFIEFNILLLVNFINIFILFLVRQTTNSPLNSEMITINDQISFSTLASKRITENQHNRPREASTSSGMNLFNFLYIIPECVTPDLLNGGQSPGHQVYN